MVAYETQGHTGKIQNQIVHIKSSQQRKQLQDLHQEHDIQTGEKEPEIVALLFPKFGQQIPGRQEENYIPGQIDNAVHSDGLIRTVNNYIPVIADGVQGYQVDVLLKLLVIGQSLHPTGRTEEKQPQHGNTVYDCNKPPEESAFLVLRIHTLPFSLFAGRLFGNSYRRFLSGLAFYGLSRRLRREGTLVLAGRYSPNQAFWTASDKILPVGF